MELKLEVVLSSSIKRKKPWPRFCWLGQEKESVFLLDDKRLSEINMVSGRTKKKTPKLHPMLNNVVTMAPSRNGLWFCGLLGTGELFLWNRDKDLLKTTTAVPEVVQLISDIRGNARLTVQVSGDGVRVLVVSTSAQLFLWECTDIRDLAEMSVNTIKGRWAEMQPLHDSLLPSIKDKETSQCTIFSKTESMGDICLSAFVFTCGKKLIITCLKVQWMDDYMNLSSMGYSIQWATKTYPMSRLTPTCQPVKSRGALVADFSPDGKLLAIVLNQRQPKATQVVFVSTQNFISVSSGLGGCGCKSEAIPSKYVRSYWVSGLSWSHDGLFLACVLKRGALLILARLGRLLSLTSTGCKVDFGPAHFLPLHPLVTYRPPAGIAEASLSSSSVSARDAMRQRYSVTWHPRLLYCIVSDGYMATVLKVLNRPSAAMLVKTVLDNTSKDLQKASQHLDTSQSYVKMCLESVSFPNLDRGFEDTRSFATSVPPATDSISPATQDSPLPLFLQDQGLLSSTKELIDKVQTFFEDDSDIDGPPAGSQPADGGRLEFASMFDTVHAPDSEADSKHTASSDAEEDFQESVHHLHHELLKIQNGLLTAWALCMSLGAALENRAHLLKYAIYRLAQLAAFLHLIPSSDVRSGKGSSWLLQLLKTILSFLPWDHSGGPQALGLVVELSRQLVHLLLGPQSEFCPASRLESLCRAVLILNLVSDSLDRAYSLQQRSVWASAEKDPQIASSDVYHVPLLQEGKEKERGVARQGLPVPHRPSSRLAGVWKWVYKVSRQYQEEIRGFKDGSGWEAEDEQLSVIISEIQRALQATGERLEEGPTLLNYTGEQLFLCGLYQNGVETLQTQIWEESKKSSRSVFQETRLCLALLYSLLAQYHLREAVELGEHMAHLVLHRAGHYSNDAACTESADPLLPTNLHIDAAYAVIHALARFMASYFTNRPLNILPAHNVAVLPPLHLPHALNVGRLVPLSQEEVARAVRQQHMSEKWTVDYALDLLLLGGLLPETAWLAFNLGDWKTAASVSLAYKNFCLDQLDFTRINRKELHLPKALLPESIFQAELQHLLDNNSQELRDITDKKFIASCLKPLDPLEGEDLALLQVSIHEILKASVMAGVNVLSSPLTFLLDSAKDLCSGLPALVHSGLYLPSPPLYCPQPSPNTQDPVGPAGQLTEIATRHKVSGVLQRMLLLLRSSHCCHPAAQWYIRHLRRARHLLFKIKMRYGYPSAAEEEKALPEGLRKFVSHGGFFKEMENKNLDSDAIHTIICFRELCGLCWMLHVRDQLSIACRKYQAARMQRADTEVLSACMDTLLWAHRYLPFSHLLNAEEILQDLLLSLVSELPPIALVADTLVLAFPEKEESVRVSLREKYNSLLQSLKQCSVSEGDKDQAKMTVLIQNKSKQRRKHLGRMLRHLAPLELRLWVKEEEDEDRGRKPGASVPRQPSPVVSVNPSTLTDTAEIEGVSPNPHSQSKARGAREKKKRTAVPAKQNVSQHDAALTSLPVVGTWEFELEDDEYLNFLELFLSYMLEKDSVDGGEPPLLKSFCTMMRERELHSLTFDVLTTMHRRQRDSGQYPERKLRNNDLPVFRAGCCQRTAKRDTTSEQQTSTSLSALALSERQTGLFSRLHSNVKELKRVSASDLSQSALQATECSVSPEAVVELQQVLDSKLEAEFPELGRLLEWMLRWADRRALQGHQGKKKKKADGTFDEGIVIRVKTSAPAVLTSLGLLEHRFSSVLESDAVVHVQVPETKGTGFPVVQPEMDISLEREAIVDTGFPETAKTPIDAFVHNEQHEEPAISHAHEPEEMVFHRTPLPDDPDELSFSAQRPVPISQGPCFEDLDVTPEKEGKSSDYDRTDVSSSLSNGISENLCSPQTSLKIADLLETPNPTSACRQAGSRLLTQTTSDPDPHIPRSVQPEVEFPYSSERLFANTPGDYPSSSQPHTSHLIPETPTVDPTGPNHPSFIQAPPMRQRIGEDLFRLVQHINYMNMMDVLGVSFSNLQLAQQNSSSFPQFGMNPSHPVVPSPHVASVTPQQNLVTPQSQIYMPNLDANNPASMYAHQLPIQSTPMERSPSADQYHYTRNLPYKTHGNDQGFQPLSVQAESPEVQSRENKNFIPSTQGLLTTDTPVIPHNGNVNIDPSSQALGFKLLQRQQNVPLQPQAPHAPNSAPVEPTSRAASRKKHKKRKAAKRFLRFRDIPYFEAASRYQTFEGSEQPASTHGLRLLHLQPDPQEHLTLSRRPSPPMPLFVPVVPLGESPQPQLLYLDSNSRTMSSPAPRLSQRTRLMSLEELTGLVAGRRNSEEARLQLLRVNDPSETNKGATPSSGSSKRQKRRERALDARKENESVIITQKPKEEPIVAEKKTPARDVTFQHGCIKSLPTGRVLLTKASSTSAELHAFAATCKRPPECLDAFTNTDPKYSPMLVDKAVSTQAFAAAITANIQHSEKLHLRKESRPRETVDILISQEERNVDQVGRNFLSVLDIEEGTWHHDLPPLSSGMQERKDASAPPPPVLTPAQLHVLATSIVNNTHAAPRDLQPSIKIPEQNVKTITQSGVLVHPPPVHPTSSGKEQERVTSHYAENPPDSDFYKSNTGTEIDHSPPSIYKDNSASQVDHSPPSIYEANSAPQIYHSPPSIYKANTPPQMDHNPPSIYKANSAPTIGPSPPSIYKSNSAPQIDRSPPSIYKANSAPQIDRIPPSIYKSNTSPQMDHNPPSICEANSAPQIDHSPPSIYKANTVPQIYSTGPQIDRSPPSIYKPSTVPEIDHSPHSPPLIYKANTAPQIHSNGPPIDRSPPSIYKPSIVPEIDHSLCSPPSIHDPKTTPQIDHSPPSKNTAVWFSSRLSELDSQLAALQNIADCLEKDLPGSTIGNELVYQPEQVSPVSTPKAVRKTVRLSLPAEEQKTENSQRKNTFVTKSAQALQLVPELDISKVEQGYQEEDEDVFRYHPNNPDRRRPSLHLSSSTQLGYDAPSSHQYTSPNHKNILTRTLETSEETADESLDQTGLSDTVEILEGLVREGYLSQTDLDMSFSDTAAPGSSRREQWEQQSWQISPRHALADDERRELRMWMRRKHRERRSVYQKQRASLREKEIKPFTTSTTSKSTGQGTGWKNTEEKQKAMLLKQFNARIREATDLASQLGGNPLTRSRAAAIDVNGMPAPAVTVRPASAPPCNRSLEKRSLKRPSGQTHAQRRPWTADVSGQASEDSRRLPRPGTSLSRDPAFSPRGLLTSAKSHEEQRFRNQRQQRRLSDVEESDADTLKLLGLGKTKSTGLVDTQNDGAPAGVSGMDWLDRVSESGGSSLSEIDWAAIEKMAAAEEP
ncbi:ciliogenesis and planar polarity effector 1 isoform X1 [Nerophis ophidion]|uniref:ciliogenesis and planar polarity effector 1 isoform X1 n=1 Tax=Nerophis ophidion TaxID=159077 RepID=UPI002AE0069F|nr:ciliogenesis and planar polarity effector 1 isoform X1 [Nerophis ophidion]XP_061731708.1 ciliogenesis and planar polarity effector 1 isoform X1 [Nerophis ophidion]XP_061731709.1 ciliogenesis and planar polarity effector 1 isoform X1 [Nerophis ophidion]XP_061731710.1 ciliogenesis and planar polarity effector 1 isoform X1 [Nerophis ophidion]